MEQIGDFIVRALNHVADEQMLQSIAREVGDALSKNFRSIRDDFLDVKPAGVRRLDSIRRLA